MTMPASPAVTPADVGHHYDELDGFYRKLWGLHVHHGLWRTGKETTREATDALTDLIADLGEIGEGARVADVGCGYGESARRIWRERGADITGFTVSAAQHKTAQTETPEGGPEFLLRDWHKNDQPDEYFDTVMAIESLSHIPDRQKTFSEAARVLKPGGKLVLVDWLRGDHIKPWEQKHLLQPICDEGRLPSLDRVADYRGWIEEAGLKVVHEEDISKHVAKTWTLVIGRVLKALVTEADTRRYLFDKAKKERSFVLSPFRLRLAFATGAFRFVVLKAEKPT